MGSRTETGAGARIETGADARIETGAGARIETGADVRAAARGGYSGLTVGRAPGYAQANLVVLPEPDAGEFLAFCSENPRSCPVLGRSRVGDRFMPSVGDDVDITTDLPRYEVHAGGVVRTENDVRGHWRSDLVSVALGCWFGAEEALNEAGVRLRHVELGIQGPLFRTALDTVAVGRFAPKLVVSMRPFRNADLARVSEITARLPGSHGAPIHIGDPAVLGIQDPGNPQWGERLIPEPGETAVFWACGLTATEALVSAGLEFFITHAPGSMLVTDLPAR